MPGRWLVATAVTTMGVGVAVGQPVIMGLGAAPVIALLWAMASARCLLHEVQSGGLVAALDASDGPLRTSVDHTLKVMLVLVGESRAAIRGVRLKVGCAGALEASTTRDGAGWCVALSAMRVGYGWIQGCRVDCVVAGGLVRLSCWLPVHQLVTILPRRFPLSGGGKLSSTRPSLQERAGVGRSRRRGFGLELRELRDHQHGDSFKHIAWAATARRGHLVTREFESDTMVSAWILIDVSPSMFWGTPGNARIDFALEAAFGLSTTLLGRGDRVGVMLYDEQVRVAAAPARGRGQGTRVLEVLLEAPHLVHEDRTELTERELNEGVMRWFEAHEQRSFHLPWGGQGRGATARLLDDRGLHEAVTEHLDRARESRPGQRFIVRRHEYARAERQANYRAFCRHAGVSLPLDPTPRAGGQARGLEAAVQYVLRQGGGPHTLIAVSDLHSVEDHEALRRAAIGARRHRHGVVVLCPADPGFIAEPASLSNTELGGALEEVARLRVRQGLATVEAVLRPAGVTIVACNPEDSTPRLLQHLDHLT
jgi:uncharacterized protein (DUF58 family)